MKAWLSSAPLLHRGSLIAISAVFVTSFVVSMVWEYARPPSSVVNFLFPPVPPPRYLDWQTSTSFEPVNQPDASVASIDELCRSFPYHRLESDLQPVFKIGHTEPQARTRSQFESVSACFSDEHLLLVSDLDETVYGRTAIDVINDLPDSYFVDNDELRDYTIVRDAWQNRNSTTTTADDGAVNQEQEQEKEEEEEEEEELPTLQGWNLDKYKFLPMVERAWTMRPGRKWYMFYESDTYVVWDNLFRLIDNLDPDATPLYIGRSAPGRYGTTFAHGGSGFLLNRAAMEKLLRHEMDQHGQLMQGALAEQWRDELVRGCCGDGNLGWILHEYGVLLTNIEPMWAEPSLRNVLFGKENWCQPLIAMHRTSPENAVKLWRWEHEMRTQDMPLLYRDFFNFHHGEDLPAQIEDWDNMGDNPYLGEVGADSLEACELACTDEPACVQYRWHEPKCRLMETARYGDPRGAESEGEQGESRFVSGWDLERLRILRGRECPTAQWVWRNPR